jgi:hypothetical protein
MMFDVMGYMQQLQRAGGISPQNTIVPNTLDMALQPTTEVSSHKNDVRVDTLSAYSLFLSLGGEPRV